MDRQELFKLYERLYFHEIEYRDKIAGRLQLPLAIYISFLTLIGFMVRNINFGSGKTYLILFGIFLVLGSLLVSFGIFYFIKSFYGGSYEFLPTANETEKYRKQMDSMYKDYDNGDELTRNYLKEYLYKYYHECSSRNAETNDFRSRNLHNSNTLIVAASVPLMITFLIFNFGDVDKNLIEKRQVVEIKEPLKIILPKEMSRTESPVGDRQLVLPRSEAKRVSGEKVKDPSKKKQPSARESHVR